MINKISKKVILMTQNTDYFKEHVLHIITQHRGIEQALTKNKYEPAMDAYGEACREIFLRLDDACAEEEWTVQEAAAWFLDRLASDWENQKRSVRDNDKFMIAVFTVPMIRRLDLRFTEDFCSALHELWMERYPKSPWQIGDFETINTSFRKKYLGLCFITTAVCLEEGKDDNCAELTAFRSFRDGYLQTCPDGPALIEEYYRIAPAIVLEIDKSADPKAHYAAIRREYLDLCYTHLQAENMEACKEHYTRMVRALQKQYLS